MRQLHEHKTNPANEELTIQVLDEPGQGGAHHEYSIRLRTTPGASYPIDRFLGDVAIDPQGRAEGEVCRLSFQNGPIREVGVNGITQEALLAVLIDRLRSFQSGPFCCRENAIALTHLEDALMWLQKRTRERMVRGVEGTNQK